MNKIIALLLALLAIPAIAADNAPRYILPPTGRGPLPFSEGVVVGKTLYIAGHLGLDPNTGQAPADASTEVKLVMDAVQQTVTSAGMKMSDVTSITVYCTDLDLYDTFNAGYRTYFTDHFPARAFIGVAKLLRGAHFEVQGIAVRTSPAK